MMAINKMTVFNFSTPFEFTHKVSDNLTLNITRVTYSVAHLFFTDNENKPVKIPFEFKIYTFGLLNNKTGIVYQPIDNMNYVLV